VQFQPKNLIASGPADSYYVRGLTEPSESSFHHGAKPERARLALGLQNTTEGIQVMASDHGSARRQIKD
jgi:hypothetical protein